MTETCHTCFHSHTESECPRCAEAHAKACRRLPTFDRGHRIPSQTLDQQEGNSEEYFGTVGFAVKRFRA